MKNFSKIIIIIFLLILYTFINCYSYANTVFSNLSSNIFRLHILANSNNIDDQNLKLKVRDNIIKNLEPKMKNCKTKNQAIKIIKSNLKELQKIAITTIKENGYDYNVTLKIGKFSFPTKYYGNISLPAGNYNALRIELGKAKGDNWWCSLFPSLCFSKVTNGTINKNEKEKIKESLNLEEYNLITQNKPGIKFKFKIIELFNK